MLKKIKALFMGEAPPAPQQKPKKRNNWSMYVSKPDTVYEIPSYTKYDAICGILSATDPVDKVSWQLIYKMITRNPEPSPEEIRNFWIEGSKEERLNLLKFWEKFKSCKIPPSWLEGAQETFIRYMSNANLSPADIGITQREFDWLIGLPHTGLTYPTEIDNDDCEILPVIVQEETEIQPGDEIQSSIEEKQSPIMFEQDDEDYFCYPIEATETLGAKIISLPVRNIDASNQELSLTGTAD